MALKTLLMLCYFLDRNIILFATLQYLHIGPRPLRVLCPLHGRPQGVVARGALAPPPGKKSADAHGPL